MNTQIETNELLQNQKTLPGPKGFNLLRWGMRIPKNPLKTYKDLHTTFGDLVYCAWPNRETLFIYHPDAIGHILRANHTNYLKGREYIHMKPLLGNGLLLSEGDLWRRQRQLMAKEFHHQRIDSYMPVITQEAETLAKNWQQGGTIDIAPDLMEATFVIAAKLFFGLAPSGRGAEVRQALHDETIRTNNRIRRIFNLPRTFPCPENWRGERGIKILNEVVSDVMSKAPESENNVLSRLMKYRDLEGNPLPNELIRNEVMTLLLAGHETTSNLLSWTLWLLAKNPEWQEKASEDDSEKVLTNCIMESMRLFPPAPMISRCAKEDDVIMGHPIKAGTTVLALQWVTHRDERYWSEPLLFNPDRFNSPLKHEYSYFPFARGPRSCIGEEMAMRESIVILRTLLNKFIFKLVPNFKVIPTHHITLRPKDGLKLELIAR